MSFEMRLMPLGECIEKVIDNRGKTPPLSEVITSYGLIEVNALVGSSKAPNYGAIRKYVDETTYRTWFRNGHPQKGDLLFSTVGSIAEVAILDSNNGCIAQNLVGLRTKTELEGVMNLAGEQESCEHECSQALPKRRQ